MKICPRCQKNYADDNLNFCLEDGSVLSVAPSGQMMQDTIVMTEPRITQPQPPPSTSTAAPPPGWQQPQQYPIQPPKKSSKTWLWVVGILGVLVLLCGGGFIGLIFWAASKADNTANSVFNIDKFNSPTPSNKKNTSNTSTLANTSTTTETTTAIPASNRTEVTTIELSKFTQQFTVFGTTEMQGDELILGSLTKGYYFVVVAANEGDDEESDIEEYKTENADSRVTVRNISDANSRLGYGLVFHSKPKPLEQDYAFLIDAKRQRYRIVHHKPQQEDPVKNWTVSPAINGGTEANTLEVRDQPDKIDLYINGTLVASIQNVYGYSGGIVGIYSGDGVKIAFKDLEIRR